MADERIVKAMKLVDPTTTSQQAGVDSSGNLQVAVNAALPAGTNAIGKLSANDAVDIGDVTINNASGASAVNIQDGGNSITVDGTVTANAGSGTFAISAASLPLPSGAATETSLAKLTLAQGSATSGQTGLLNLAAVTTAAPSYTTGQSSPLSLTTGGSLRVDIGSTGTVAATQSGTWNVTNISGTVSLPTGAATSANQSTIITALQLIDNAVFATGTAAGTTDGGYNVLAIRKDTPAALSGVVDGDYTPLSVDSTGKLHVNVGNASLAVTGTFWQATQPVSIAAAVAVTDNSGSLTVDNGGTFAVQAAQSGTWNITNVSGTVSLPTGAATETTLGSVKTAVELIDDSIVSQGSTTTGVKTVLAGAKNNSGNAAPLNLDSSGNLNVNIASGTISAGGSPTTPQKAYKTTASLSAGSTTADSFATAHCSGDLSAGTYYCAGFTASASVPIKVALHTVANSVVSTNPLVVVFASAGDFITWMPPHKDFMSFTSTATAGDDGFLLRITNMDTSEAADVYSTIFYQS